jgi:pyruvate ferredoxin oxidoreductase alpha subunit
VIRRAFVDYDEMSGRRYGVVDDYDCESAEIILVGIGSMMQTARWTARAMREKGKRVGVLNLRSFRPFPSEEVARVAGRADVVVVLDRDIGYGTSGMVYQDVVRSLYALEDRPRAINCIIGTGGKDITPKTVERCVELATEHEGRTAVFWPDARGPREGIPYTEGLEVPQ